MSDYAIDPPALIGATIGSRSEQACSPADPAPLWSGVLVNGPRRIAATVGAPVIVPVCGNYSVPIEHTIRPVATLHLRISGEPPIEPQSIGLDDPENEAGPQMPLSHPGQQYVSNDVSGYFAVDLGRFINLPAHPARVEYIIEFGGHRTEVKGFDWQPIPPKAPPRR